MKSKAIINTWELLFVQSYGNKDHGGHRTHRGSSTITLEHTQLRALDGGRWDQIFSPWGQITPPYDSTCFGCKIVQSLNGKHFHVWNIQINTCCTVSFTLLPLYFRGNSPEYPLYRRLGGPQSRFGRFWEANNLLPWLGIESRLLGRPTRRLVAIQTELSRFCSPQIRRVKTYRPLWIGCMFLVSLTCGLFCFEQRCLMIILLTCSTTVWNMPKFRVNNLVSP
jgi:hypothetical protein